MATTPDRDTDISEQYNTVYDLEHGAQLMSADTIADRDDDTVSAKLRAWRDQASELNGIV